jgi:hypothetical protein
LVLLSLPRPCRGPLELCAPDLTGTGFPSRRPPRSRGTVSTRRRPQPGVRAGGVERAHFSRIPRGHGHGRGSGQVRRSVRPDLRRRPWLSTPARGPQGRHPVAASSCRSALPCSALPCPARVAAPASPAPPSAPHPDAARLRWGTRVGRRPPPRLRARRPWHSSAAHRAHAGPSPGKRRPATCAPGTTRPATRHCRQRSGYPKAPKAISAEGICPAKSSALWTWRDA